MYTSIYYFVGSVSLSLSLSSLPLSLSRFRCVSACPKASEGLAASYTPGKRRRVLPRKQRR